MIKTFRLFLGLLTVPFLAFLGALGATFIVLGVSRFAGATSADRLVLAGVAVSFIIMAGAHMLIFLGDPRATHTVVFLLLLRSFLELTGTIVLAGMYLQIHCIG